jgi:hypothetical protein
MSLAGLESTIQSIAALPRYIAQKHLLQALNRSIKPTKQALLGQVAGIGTVTGNLKRAVTSRSVLYPSGVAAAVVGFRRTGRAKGKPTGGSVQTGPDRAFHSHLIEFGTKARKPLNMFGRQLQRSARGRRQRAALERAGLGDTLYRDYGTLSSIPSRGTLKPFIVTISPRGKRQVEGGPALHPMRNAFNQTASQVASKLASELAKALENAVKENAKRSGGGEDAYFGA